MERAPKTFLQTSRGPRALHSGRTHPCLHYGYGVRPDVAALRLEHVRETSPSVCHTRTRFFSAPCVLHRHSSATSGLPPPPPFRQGSVKFLRAHHSILSTGSPTPLRYGESGLPRQVGEGCCFISHPPGAIRCALPKADCEVIVFSFVKLKSDFCLEQQIFNS